MSAEPNPIRGRNWRLRLATFAAAAVFLGLVLRFWHPVYGFTSFLQLDAAHDATRIAPLRGLPIYVYRNTGAYDGLYYAQIACDPLLREADLKGAIDNLPYRARRILVPAIAWLIGAGRPGSIVQAYSLVNVAAWIVLAVLLWGLLAVNDGRSWLAWAGVLFSAGALASVRYALTDLVALALIAGAMTAREQGKQRSAIGWLAAAGLARETSLLAIPALWEMGICSRSRKTLVSGSQSLTTDNPVASLGTATNSTGYLCWANVWRTLIAILPLAAWIAYVSWQAGPANPSDANFTWPLLGFAEKWSTAVAALNHPQHFLLAWTSLLAMAGLTVQAVFILKRPDWQEAWWRLGAAYVALMVFLGAAVWADFPGAALRALLPLALAFNVLAIRRRSARAWLLVGNLGVFAGLLTLRDVPFDTREIGAVRSGGLACLVRVGDGWFDCEHSRGNVWSWSSGHGRVDIETWPHDVRPVRLAFSLHSLAPRTVAITQNGRELWRASVEMKGAPVTLTVRTDEGHANLEFTTDSPAVPENARPDARPLAFEIYDLRVEAPK